MDSIFIDGKTLQDLLDIIEELKQKLNEFIDKAKLRRLSNWGDLVDICRILNISKRTLARYRGNGTINYSKIGDRILYRVEDVSKLLSRNEERRLKIKKEDNERLYYFPQDKIRICMIEIKTYLMIYQILLHLKLCLYAVSTILLAQNYLKS